MNCKILNISSNELYEHITSFETKNKCISFFTPTYNRAQLLDRVYTCLKEQTNKNFLWIIVNDGSSDDTDSYGQKILEENIIPILYIKKENGGKHSAFKVALDHCETEYFQCMDDDDIYDENAVDMYLNLWKKIELKGENMIGAIRTLARRNDGSLVVSKSIKTGNIEDLSTLDMNYVRKCSQENWTCYRTAALREIDLFPTTYWLSSQHKFFSEAIWQGRFARKYKCRYVYITLREYTTDAELSIIRSAKSRQHYLDMFINQKIIFEEQYDYIKASLFGILRNIASIQILRKFLGISQKELLDNTNSRKYRIWYRVGYPISFLAPLILKH